MQWSHIEQTAKHTIQERKIRVLFLPADGTSGAPSINGAASNNDISSQRSPSPEPVTPQRTSNVPVGAVSRVDSRPSSSKNVSEAVGSAFNPATSGQSSIGAAVSSVTSAIPTSTEELKAQLQDARATISRLEQQASQGLRQRKGESVGGKDKAESSGLAIQQTPSGGVPVQIVAGLCLFSFLLAYFFF